MNLKFEINMKNVYLRMLCSNMETFSYIESPIHVKYASKNLLFRTIANSIYFKRHFTVA